ncbi:UDP-N-acetyl-D-glucosamine dehydrogenase [Pilimelia terevasa]|uniref:UDP-N-acetyl-D-glucosamine dehydrogenase n=1 Tax=Pilimelia terevasa TaxID=53372 RepID=A0A8J3FFY9_9ACTN|nr:nucleotide sugar dehydrogenase [Pilimelia terevasa]GGK22336.1 UDP-N-acetyl-D-glucosamine dehydrogenase [Pilimelia terevasa]
MKCTPPSLSRVAVVGQGYVGLPAARAAVEAGHTVVGYDIDVAKIEALRSGVSPIDDLTDGDVSGLLGTGRYLPTRDARDLAGFDVALVTVPTPLREDRPDLTAVLAAAGDLAAHLRPGCLVVLESTVAPGTTDGEFREALERNAAGITVEDGDLLVGFSPERIDPGNATWHFGNTPKLVSGVNSASRRATESFYSGICDTVVACPSAATAEMAKLLENTYRHVNIALVNELSRHAHALHVSIWDVLDAAASKPYGYQRFNPGPGVGGHCLPVDPAYLSDRIERTLGRRFDFVDLAMRVNADQPRYVYQRIVEQLNDGRMAVNGAHVLVLGLAYKPNSGDTRETPTTGLIEQLVRGGAAVSVADPLVRDLPVRLAREFPGVKPVAPGDIVAAAARADLCVLVTDHDAFDYPAISAAATRLLDTRNRFAPAPHVSTL